MLHSEAQFLEELNRHAGIIHKICRAYFADEEQRKDMFQEIVYQLWKSYPSFKGLSKFSTWMYRIALNTALTFERRDRRQALVLQSPEALLLPEQVTAEQTEEQAVTLLYAAIQQLSDLEKAVILLYLEGHSYEEVAAITGLSRVNVSVKLVRIKKKLEKRLKHQSEQWKI